MPREKWEAVAPDEELRDDTASDDHDLCCIFDFRHYVSLLVCDVFRLVSQKNDLRNRLARRLHALVYLEILLIPHAQLHPWEALQIRRVSV